MDLASKTATRFETDRFIVRRYETSDEDELYAAARSSIPEIFRFLPWCHADYAREDATSWLKQVKPTWEAGTAYSFGIFDKADGKSLHGGCGVNQIDEHPIANLGYWVRTSSAGNGVATEATRGLVKFAFTVLALQRVEIVMSEENQASRGVAVSAGAIYEGMARNRLLLHGKRHNAHVYSIVPGDPGY